MAIGRMYMPARKFPDLPIVLGHAGGGLYVLEAIVAASVCPNIFVELSSLMPHHVQEVLAHVPEIGRALAEMAAPANRPKLWYGIWSGFAVAIGFAVLAASAAFLGLTPWKWAYMTLVSVKLLTNSLAWLGLAAVGPGVGLLIVMLLPETRPQATRRLRDTATAPGAFRYRRQAGCVTDRVVARLSP